jgi:ubiE/COQ5 methyltransferase family
MFASIVPRYDTVNTLMTLGLDRRWRRQTVTMAEPRGGIGLDIATGTGELAFEMVRQGASTTVGADFCVEMVESAVAKVVKSGGGTVRFTVADAMRLPFADATFDFMPRAQAVGPPRMPGFDAAAWSDAPSLRPLYCGRRAGARCRCGRQLRRLSVSVSVSQYSPERRPGGWNDARRRLFPRELQADGVRHGRDPSRAQERVISAQ